MGQELPMTEARRLRQRRRERAQQPFEIVLAEHRVPLQSVRAPQPKKRLRSDARNRPEKVLRTAEALAARSPPKVVR